MVIPPPKLVAEHVDVGTVTMEELSALVKAGYTSVGFDIVPEQREAWEAFLRDENGS